MAIKSAKTRGELNTPIRQGLEFLCQTFGQEIDAWERAAYERTLKGIDAGILGEAAQLLVDQAAAGRKFYPMPKAPDWKAACAEIITERRKKARERHLADCTHASQWVDDGKGYLVRCPCFVRMVAALDSIGHLHLPPAPEDAPKTTEYQA